VTPTNEHVLFIPGVLIVGVWIGFWLGARSARAELERREQRRRE
jgi:uncharacterized protein YneF (UPF0154 family)